MGPFTFNAVPSAHEELDTDEHGDYKCIGFIFEVGGRVIYHSGDCLGYDGLAGHLKRWKIDLALLPINGRDLSRGVPGNFDSESASRLGREIGAKLIVPCHYEMFEFNSVSPQSFAEAAGKIGQEYYLMMCGERLDL